MFAREGNLSSPNFPLFYPPTTNCAWTIQVSFAQNVSNQVGDLYSIKIEDSQEFMHFVEVSPLYFEVLF